VVKWYSWVQCSVHRDKKSAVVVTDVHVTVIADRSMQLNEGLFMMNNRCGYVLQPDCMRHPAYDPYDKQSLSRVNPPVEPVHVSLLVSTWSIWVISPHLGPGQSPFCPFTSPLLHLLLYLYPRESEGICIHRRWFVCVCVSVCLYVTTITKKLWTDLHHILCEGS